MKIIVVKPHTREFENPIILSVGDRVQVDINRGKHWLGDVYCTLIDGNSGWAWGRAFENQDSNRPFEGLEGDEAIVYQEFSSNELTVEIGEILESHTEAGWCCNARGEFGWIPEECFEIDKDDLKRRQVELIEEIEVAFAHVELGHGIGLRQSWQLEATYDSSPEASQRIADAAREDIEPWQDLSDELLNEYFDALNCSWTDSDGFRYLMPACMRCSLRNISNKASFSEFTVHRLLEGLCGKMLPRLGLSVDQIRVTAKFCELMLDMWIIAWCESAQWQRTMTHQLFQQINEGLSPGWFKRPL
jgi:hypothetical protein